MKRFLTTLCLTATLLLPLSAQAYSYNYFKVRDPFQQKQYVPNPLSSMIPGWPDWIGRLDAISRYYYGKRYNQLDETQRAIVLKLSKEWPDWIGVPPWLQK